MVITVSDAATTQPLRRAVLRPGWPAGAPMHGDENAVAVHLAALEDGVVVGVCLVLPRAFPSRPDESGAWQLRGMATDPARQGRGIGAQVVAAAAAEIARRGGQLIWCEARTSAMGFYTHHGFTIEGTEYLHAETATPHYLMWRAVS